MPKLPKSIALHIGVHKTASTHLQTVLDKNKSLLIKDGIRFYGPSELRSNNRELTVRFNLSGSKGPAPELTPHEQLEYLAQGCGHLVFSEENIAGTLTNHKGKMQLPVYPNAFKRIEELAACWAPLEPDLFVCVRNPAAYVSSAYGQCLNSAPSVEPQTFRDLNNWRSVDWANFVARIRAIPGLGNVTVWRQEDYANNQRDVYRQMIPSHTADNLKLLKHYVNKGLSTEAVKATLRFAAEGKTDGIVGKARKEFPINKMNEPFKLYTAETYAEADQIYADQMARIAGMDGVTLLYQNKDASGDVEKG